MIRALRTHGTEGPQTLAVEEIEAPEPGPGEVAVRARAAALNYPDILLMEGRYQLATPRPFTPGSEVAGEVAAVGTGVTDVKPGDRVVGLTTWGALADIVIVPEKHCIPIADGAPFDEAAALMVAFGTSHYALRDRGGIRAGDTLIVLGASGGVGSAAVRLGKMFDAHVVAAVSSADKAELARGMGADAAVLYPPALSSRDDARSLTQALRSACPAGAADLVYDPVGGAYSEAAFRTLGWRGRHLVIGFTAGIPSIPLNLPLLKEASVIGVSYGTFVDREPERRREYLAEIAAWNAQGLLAPHISCRLPLDRAAEGYAMLKDRRSSGKIVISF